MATLKERKAELEKEFNALGDERTKLIEEGKGLNKRLSEIQARQLQINGAFLELDRMEKEESKKEVKK